MSIVCYIGLPGAGKTYTVVKEVIVPALRQGRKVITNVDGVNARAIAEYLQLTQEEINDLLVVGSSDDFGPATDTALNIRSLFPREGVDPRKDHSRQYRDAVIVIDEIQNIYPAGNKKVCEDGLLFVSKHRHQGYDIVMVSQSFKSIAKEFRVRTQYLHVLRKRTGLGKTDSYIHEVHETSGTGDEKFQKMSSKVLDYDPKVFALYASFDAGTTNTRTLIDKRATIFASGLLQKVAVYALVLIVAVGYLWRFFDRGEGEAEAKQTAQSAAIGSLPQATIERSKKSKRSKAQKHLIRKEQQQRNDHLRMFAENEQWRMTARISIDGAEDAIFERLQGGRQKGHVRLRQLLAMGYEVRWDGDGYTITKAGFSTYAMPWKIDVVGRVSEEYHVQKSLGAR